MIRKKTALHIFFTKNQRRRTWSRTSLRISKRELCRGEAGKMSRRRRAEEGRFVVVAKEFHGHSRSTENEEEQNLLCFLYLSLSVFFTFLLQNYTTQTSYVCSVFIIAHVYPSHTLFLLYTYIYICPKYP